MRIPFSSFRFQEAAGKTVMGLKSYRWIPHKKEQLILPAIPNNWGGWSAWKPSQVQEIIFEEINSRTKMYVTLI